MLDTRYFRSSPLKKKTPVTKGEGPYEPNPDPTTTMLGEDQWRWLEEQLRTPAEVRLIASSIQVVAEDHGWEKWMNLPHERERLYRLIRETGAEGVVFLSGDRHLAELSMMDGGAGYPFYDVTSSGLNQAAKSWRPQEVNRHRVATMNWGDNFGLITIDWDRPDPRISLQIRDVERRRLPRAAARPRHAPPATAAWREMRVPGVRGDRPRRPRARLRPVRVNRERDTTGAGDERRRRESNPLLRFCRPPPGRQAPAPSLLRPSLSEGHVLARNRTWSSTFAKSCARPSHPEDVDRNQTCCRVPHPGIEPGLAASKAAVRPPHPRGNSRVPSPGVEPGLRPSGGRVPSVTLQGLSRSRRPDSNRHEPAYKAGASPFGHVGEEQGRKDSNPVREFWRLAALPGAHPCKGPRPVPMPGRCCSITPGAGPARAAGTGPSSRPGRPGPRRAASTRGGPAGAGAACRPARACGRPCGRCSDAGGDAVGPARRTALRARHDVVDRDRLGAGLRPAVLAGVMVALGHVPPAEGHRRPGQPVVVRQADDLGDPEPRPRRPDARARRPRARARAQSAQA